MFIPVSSKTQKSQKSQNLKPAKFRATRYLKRANKPSAKGIISMCNQMVKSEIIRIWTKRKWNYFLISRVYHLITY